MSNKKKSVVEKEEATEEVKEPETVRMFKDDFDAMQQEADKLVLELNAVNEELLKQKNRADEMTIQAQRLQAEFDNYRKRTNETNKRVRQDGAVEVLSGILPVLDAIEQAKAMIKDESTLGGIEIINRQLLSLLTAQGVEQIEALNMPFDPMQHNAVMEEDAPKEQKGMVVKVYQNGYKMGDRVLRHAVVIVGK